MLTKLAILYKLVAGPYQAGPGNLLEGPSRARVGPRARLPRVPVEQYAFFLAYSESETRSSESKRKAHSSFGLCVAFTAVRMSQLSVSKAPKVITAGLLGSSASLLKSLRHCGFQN